MTVLFSVGVSLMVFLQEIDFEAKTPPGQCNDTRLLNKLQKAAVGYFPSYKNGSGLGQQTITKSPVNSIYWRGAFVGLSAIVPNVVRCTQ